jgi:AraC-like DNA-binding protein
VMLLPTGACTIDRAAQHLGIDRRTIHRHLAREDQTFSRIVEAVRVELAERYVKEPRRALTETSSLRGFSAPSAFSRWYRRSFGRGLGATRGRPRPRSELRGRFDGVCEVSAPCASAALFPAAGPCKEFAREGDDIEPHPPLSSMRDVPAPTRCRRRDISSRASSPSADLMSSASFRACARRRCRFRGLAPRAA